jgi:hypothetical protein
MNRGSKFPEEKTTGVVQDISQLWLSFGVGVKISGSKMLAW